MTRKQLAQIDDADFGDCVNTGWRWTLYADGRVAAEYHSRWQGSRDGARYTTDPGWLDVADIDPSDPDSDAEALLTEAVRDIDPENDRSFRATRRGILVR